MSAAAPPTSAAASSGAAERPDEAGGAGVAGPSIGRLLKRRDFVAASQRGARYGTASMMTQGRVRTGEEPAAPQVRVGFTCSKKVGNAVARNRAKRRLRAAAAEVMPGRARPGWDYVLIGRRDDTAGRAWPDLLRDLERAIDKLHERADGRRG